MLIEMTTYLICAWSDVINEVNAMLAFISSIWQINP